MSCKVISINVYAQKARQEPLFEILPERSNALLHNTPNPCPPINSSLEMKYVSLVLQKRKLQQRNNSICTDQSCLLDVKTLQLFAEDRNSLQKTPTKSKALVICITWIARMNRMHCFATSKYPIGWQQNVLFSYRRLGTFAVYIVQNKCSTWH